MPPQPTSSELRVAFEMFSRAFTGASAIYVWKTHLLPRLLPQKEDIEHYLAIGRNASTQSSLVCIRTLDDFFLEPEKLRFDDDVAASDFGFNILGSPLGNTERTRINKLVVHMSYEPLWNAENYSGPHGDGSFDFPVLFVAVIRRAKAFLEFCSPLPMFSSAEDQRQISAMRKLAESLIHNVTRIGNHERGLSS